MATGEHVEVELKLYVPDDRFDAVDAALRSTGDVHEVHLHAEYVDTVDWQLSLHGLTWRIRREGERWVQTLKARGDSAGDIERIEHDVDITDRVGPGAGPPAPDPALHHGTAAGSRIAHLLADAATESWKTGKPVKVS